MCSRCFLFFLGPLRVLSFTKCCLGVAWPTWSSPVICFLFGFFFSDRLFLSPVFAEFPVPLPPVSPLPGVWVVPSWRFVRLVFPVPGVDVGHVGCVVGPFLSPNVWSCCCEIKLFFPMSMLSSLGVNSMWAVGLLADVRCMRFLITLLPIVSVCFVFFVHWPGFRVFGSPSVLRMVYHLLAPV